MTSGFTGTPRSPSSGRTALTIGAAVSGAVVKDHEYGAASALPFVSWTPVSVTAYVVLSRSGASGSNSNVNVSGSYEIVPLTAVASLCRTMANPAKRVAVFTPVAKVPVTVVVADAFGVPSGGV